MDSKQARQDRQLKVWKQLVKEMKESVAQSYYQKVQKDAYYQDNDKVFTVSEVY